MNFYEKHLFFCINQKKEGKKCCELGGASGIVEFTRERLKGLNLHGAGQFRVSSSGCMGRCKQGPCLVIYPDGVWYNYASEGDIELIIEQHLIDGKIVEHLLMPEC